MFHYGLNRYLCGVFDDMRKILAANTLENSANLHSSALLMLNSLIEEAQVLGNRMEARLEDASDLKDLHTEISKSKAKLKKLEEAIEPLEDK